MMPAQPTLARQLRGASNEGSITWTAGEASFSVAIPPAHAPGMVASSPAYIGQTGGGGGAATHPPPPAAGVEPPKGRGAAGSGGGGGGGESPGPPRSTRAAG